MAYNEPLESPRYERIHGVEVMLARPIISHLQVAANLLFILKGYLRGKRCKVYAEPDVYFDEDNHCIPDLVIVCDPGKIKVAHIEGAPDFVAEILSPSTGNYDMGAKMDIYERFGVREYWLIDPKSKAIMVYLLQDGRYVFSGRYTVLEEGEAEALNEKELAEHKLSLKLSLYDDLEIKVQDVFED